MKDLILRIDEMANIIHVKTKKNILLNFGFRRSISISKIFFPDRAKTAAKFNPIKVLPSPLTVEEIEEMIEAFSGNTNFILVLMERKASLIADFDSF